MRMTSNRLATGLVAAAVIATGIAEVSAARTPPCGRHDAVLDHLARQFDEHVRLQALQDDGRLLELTASADGATWTALLTAANGVTCVVAAGHHFVALPRHSEGAGDDGL